MKKRRKKKNFHPTSRLLLVMQFYVHKPTLFRSIYPVILHFLLSMSLLTLSIALPHIVWYWNYPHIFHPFDIKKYMKKIVFLFKWHAVMPDIYILQANMCTRKYVSYWYISHPRKINHWRLIFNVKWIDR